MKRSSDLVATLGAPVNRILRRFGYAVVPTPDSSVLPSVDFPDATEQDREITSAARPFTMTSDERIWSLLESVRYLTRNGIQGDFVECGVWRGGSVMAMMLMLAQLNDDSRVVWLYDTFEGMTPPSDADVEISSGQPAEELLASSAPLSGENIWALSPVAEVERNVRSTGYPADLVRIRQGDVTDTLRTEIPEQIALLRLDTDWYDSTLLELEILFPRLVTGGICIIDDYGHWRGSRRAVDEYFARQTNKPLLSRIDYSGRLIIKS